MFLPLLRWLCDEANNKSFKNGLSRWPFLVLFCVILCETKVLASRRDGREDLLAEHLVALVLWEIKLCIIR